MPSTCEVREMRRAEAELVIILWSLESGLRSKDSWVRSEGGCWKRAERYLAGGLPYGKHGFEAEVDGAIYPSTVTLYPQRRLLDQFRFPGLFRLSPVGSGNLGPLAKELRIKVPGW